MKGGVSELDEWSDESLIQYSSRGNQVAFEILFRRYERSVARMIRYQVSDRTAQEDVFQETVLAAWRHLGSLQNPDKFKGWILQLARNKCHDYYRGQKRVEQPLDSEVLDHSLNRHGAASQKGEQLTERILDEVEQLSPAEKQLMHRFYFQGLTIAEIALRSGVPAGTIKRRLYTARKRIRKKMKLNEERSPDDEQ